MDEIVFNSVFGKMVLGKFIKKWIKKAYGASTSPKINSFQMLSDGQITHLELTVSMDIRKDELMKIVEKLTED